MSNTESYIYIIINQSATALFPIFDYSFRITSRIFIQKRTIKVRRIYCFDSRYKHFFFQHKCYFTNKRYLLYNIKKTQNEENLMRSKYIHIRNTYGNRTNFIKLRMIVATEFAKILL